jgi:hypothetical protein
MRAPRQTTVRTPSVHTEAPQDPSVHAPCRRATVRDVCGCLDGARWLYSTRRCANRRSPLGRWSAARRRALLPTPRVHRRRGCPQDLLTDLQRLQIHVRGRSFARAYRHPSPAVLHWRRPVQTSLPLTLSPPQTPELFLVHH